MNMLRQRVLNYLTNTFTDKDIDNWLKDTSKEDIVSELIWMIEPMCKTTVVDYMYTTGENIRDTIKKVFKQLS